MQKVTAKTVLTLSLAIVVLALIVSAISRFTGQTRITIPASVTVAGAASKTVTPSTAPTAATAVSHATTSVTATASVSSGHQLSANLRQKLELGRQAFDNRHYAQSIALEDEVLQADPQAYEADSIKGIAQAYRGNFTQAMATLDQALALEPDFAGARFNKALTYELFDYYDQAISWYTKALEVEKSCWSYYGIASIYGRRGDVANTVKYLKMAIAINSGTKGAAREEKDFNPVRTSPQFQALLK